MGDTYVSDAVDAQGVTLRVSADDGTSYIEIKEVKSFSAIGAGSASVKDVTHLKSAAKEKRLGLKDEGEISLSGNYLPLDPGQLVLKENSSTNKVLKMQIEFDDAATESGDGTKFEFDFLVNPFQKPGAEVDGILEFSATLVVTGLIAESAAS